MNKHILLAKLKSLPIFVITGYGNGNGWCSEYIYGDNTGNGHGDSHFRYSNYYFGSGYGYGYEYGNIQFDGYGHLYISGNGSAYGHGFGYSRDYQDSSGAGRLEIKQMVIENPND